MSLYGEYLKERTSDQITETKDGFATYRFTDLKGDPAVYIVEIYVVPEARKKNVASSMADEIVKFGSKAGCKWVLGSVVPSTKGSDASLRVLLAYGMTIDSCSNDFILFKRGI